MRVVIFLLIVGALLLAPFVALKRPWAVKTWERIKKFFYAYVVAITLIAIYWLITKWDQFYG